MRQKLTAFLKDESGATAIEHSLIASGIAVVLIAVVKGIGTNLKTVFGSLSTATKYANARTASLVNNSP